MKTWVNLVVLMAIIQLVSIFWISRTVSKSSFESGYKSGVMACDNKWLASRATEYDGLAKLRRNVEKERMKLKELRQRSVLSEFYVYP